MTADRINPSNRALIEAAYTANYNHIDGGADIALQIAQVLITTLPEFHTTNHIAVNSDVRPLRSPTPRRDFANGIPYKAIIHVNLFGGLGESSIFSYYVLLHNMTAPY